MLEFTARFPLLLYVGAVWKDGGCTVSDGVVTPDNGLPFSVQMTTLYSLAQFCGK